MDNGYRRRPNFSDIDNLQTATDSYYRNQRKASTMKAFVLRDIWDIFATRILIGLAVILVAAALVIGLSLRNKEPDSLAGVASGTTTAQDEGAKTTTALKAEATEAPDEDDEPEDEPDGNDDEPVVLPADEPIVTTAPAEAEVQNGTTAKKVTTTRRNAGVSQQPSGGGSVGYDPTPNTPSWTPSPDPTPAPVQTQAPSRPNNRPTTQVATNAPVRQTTAPATRPVTVVTTAAPTTYVNNGAGMTAEMRFLSQEDYSVTIQVVITNYNSRAASASSVALRLSGGSYIAAAAHVTHANYSLNGTSLLLHCVDQIPANSTYSIVATIRSTNADPTASLLAVN